MRFITVRDLRNRSAEVWRELAELREMVVTSNGKPIAVLASVSEANLEESLVAFRRARAIEAVSALQRQSVERGTDSITPAEIDAEIRQVRDGRRK